MFVNRRTFQAKVGCLDDLIRLSLDEAHRTQAQGNFQLPHYGLLDNFTLEIQFESMAAYEQFWEAWGSSEAAAKFFELSNPLSMPGGTNEFWEVYSSNLPGPLEMPHYIERLTVPVKIGCMDEVLKLAASVQDQFYLPNRVMRAVFGPGDQVSIDFAFETQAESAQAWEKWNQVPEGKAFFAQWNQLVEPGARFELLEIVK